jgi:ATP-dependent 26S proteasome regulatory subunit
MKTPLILAIQGPPGEGKTYQCRKVAVGEGIIVRTVVSAELSGELEGAAIGHLRRAYVSAAAEAAAKDRAAVLIIDDFDLSIAGTRHDTTYTVNTQLLVAFLMALCDDPLIGGGVRRRVPIVLTGNDFRTLHGPLRRHGRMDFFEWSPSRTETIQTVRSLLGLEVDQKIASDLVETFPEMTVAFFARAIEQLRVDAVLRAVNGLQRPIRISDLEAGARDALDISGSRAGGDLYDNLLVSAKRLYDEQTAVDYLATKGNTQWRFE